MSFCVYIYIYAKDIKNHENNKKTMIWNVTSKHNEVETFLADEQTHDVIVWVGGYVRFRFYKYILGYPLKSCGWVLGTQKRQKHTKNHFWT